MTDGFGVVMIGCTVEAFVAGVPDLQGEILSRVTPVAAKNLIVKGESDQ